MSSADGARRALFVGALIALGVGLAGCGGSKSSSPPPATTAAPPPPPPTATTTTSQSGPGALQAEANSAAAGDIPDNQVFLVFRNAAAGYSMKYPEGWAQQGSGGKVTFRDKNNIVRVVGRRWMPHSDCGRRAQGRCRAARCPACRARPQRDHDRGQARGQGHLHAPKARRTGHRQACQLVVDRYYLARRQGAPSSTSAPRKESTTSTPTG